MVKKRLLWLFTALVVTAASAPSVYAQRMERLGDAHVDGSTDHDSIRVGRSNGAYRAIQLRVSGGAVNFDRVIIRYGDGSSQEIPVRARIPDGDRTRLIDLPGDRRFIQSVDLWYGNDRCDKRPKVTLYGVR